MKILPRVRRAFRNRLLIKSDFSCMRFHWGWTDFPNLSVSFLRSEILPDNTSTLLFYPYLHALVEILQVVLAIRPYQYQEIFQNEFSFLRPSWMNCQNKIWNWEISLVPLWKNDNQLNFEGFEIIFKNPAFSNQNSNPKRRSKFFSKQKKYLNIISFGQLVLLFLHCMPWILYQDFLLSPP